MWGRRNENSLHALVPAHPATALSQDSPRIDPTFEPEIEAPTFEPSTPEPELKAPVRELSLFEACALRRREIAEELEGQPYIETESDKIKRIFAEAPALYAAAHKNDAAELAAYETERAIRARADQDQREIEAVEKARDHSGPKIVTRKIGGSATALTITATERAAWEKDAAKHARAVQDKREEIAVAETAHKTGSFTLPSTTIPKDQPR